MSLVIDVRDLVAQPGASRRVRISEPVEGLATEMAAVPAERAVVADLLLESVVEGILASGELRGVMGLQCARCLRTFDSPLRLAVRELFTPGASLDEDEYPMADGEIDLEPMVRDAVLLSMPFAPLCREDCLGLCDRCGGDRNEGECQCGPQADPRWSALAGLDLELEPSSAWGDD